MGMETPQRESQGTPEEIEQAEEQLSSPEAKLSDNKSRRYLSVLSIEERKLIHECDLSLSSDGRGFSGTIRGDEVFVHFVHIEPLNDGEPGFSGKLNGGELTPVEAELLYHKWFYVAEFQHITSRGLTLEEKRESDLEKETVRDSVRKLLA